MRKHKLPLWATLLLVVLAVLAGGIGGYALSLRQTAMTLAQRGIPSGFEKAAQTYQAVRDNYYKNVDQAKLTDGAIKGMLESLDDPYSVYLQSDAKTDLDETISASFGGIGATIQQKDKTLSIESILPNTPAQQVGLKVGDVVTEIDGKDVSHQTVTEAVAKIRGKIGTHVAVTIKRDGQARTFKLTRQKISVSTVTGQLTSANKHVGVITIATFSEPTVQQFKETVKTLRKEGATMFVLDLRNNPGGTMNAALAISSMFSKNGQVVMQVADKSGKTEKYIAGKKLDDGFKVKEKTVVLMDGNSASASEITAAALHDNRGIPLVGEKSFGKGTVQTVGQVDKNTELKLTVAKWLTPKGQWINHKGLTPDVTVDYPAAAKIPVITAKALKPGDNSSNVRSLKQMLAALGYDAGPISDQYDDATQAAVSKFQQNQGLTVTGSANDKTISRLIIALAQQLAKDDPMLKKAVETVASSGN